MKFINSLRKKAGILGLVAILGLSTGCATKRSFFGTTTESKIISRSSTEQDMSIKNAELTINNPKVQQKMSEGYVKIKGNAKCSYDLSEWDKWTEIWEFTDYGTWWTAFKRRVEKEETSPVETRHIEKTPSLLKVYIDGLDYPEKLVTVNADGSFETMIIDRKSTRLNSSHIPLSRMPSSA